MFILHFRVSASAYKRKADMFRIDVAARQLGVPEFFLQQLLGSIYIFSGTEKAPGKKVQYSHIGSALYSTQ